MPNALNPLNTGIPDTVKISRDLLDKFSRLNVSVMLLHDRDMLSLNSKYKGKNYATDVLSFDVREDLGGGVMQFGEIAVNIDQASRQADQYGNDLEHEIAELVAHGVLHLLGVHHPHDD